MKAWVSRRLQPPYLSPGQPSATPVPKELLFAQDLAWREKGGEGRCLGLSSPGGCELLGGWDGGSGPA